jgi:hypothetical protein
MASVTFYIIGSLRNPRIPHLAALLIAQGYGEYSEWYSGGARADDDWTSHERLRGRRYVEAIRGYHAKQVMEMDLRHLKRCDGAIMVMPCGKSGHLELGWMIGQGKPGFVLLDSEPERFDVMLALPGITVVDSEEMLLEELARLTGGAGRRTTDHAPWNS